MDTPVAEAMRCRNHAEVHFWRGIYQFIVVSELVFVGFFEFFLFK